MPLSKNLASSASKAFRTWNPSEYLSFEGSRIRPAIDLVRQVPLRNVESVVDLGCGTANMLPYFLNEWPNTINNIVCADSSLNMLERAKEFHKTLPLETEFPTLNISYDQVDFETFAKQKLSTSPDLIFSNAALHWVSYEERKDILSRLMGKLKPGKLPECGGCFEQAM